MVRLARRQVVTGPISALAGLVFWGFAARAEDKSVRAWREYIPGGWGQIHVWMAEPVGGSGEKTPLVCLHPTPSSGVYFKDFQEVMAQDRLVMSPDTPGYGGSTSPPTQPDMEDYGAAMAGALMSLGYGQDKGPVDLLGFHTGIHVGLEIARQHPKLIRKMVFAGVPYYTEEEKAVRRARLAQPAPFFSDPSYMTRIYEIDVLNSDFGVSKERHLELFTERLRAGPSNHYGYDAVFRYDPEPALRTVPHPVLLPILDDPLDESTRKAARLLKHATILEMTDTDKWTAWFSAPSLTAERFRPFLDN